MKLYTINATPVQKDASNETNAININQYPDVVAQLLKGYEFDGFTIYQVQGYWKSMPEVSFKIELALEDNQSSIDKIGLIAANLRDTYNQESVMITYPDNTVEFI